MNLPTATELRTKINEMSIEEMTTLRDELENNWSESLRTLMQILSLGCINKYKKTLASL